jgi:hypothetical protein
MCISHIIDFLNTDSEGLPFRPPLKYAPATITVIMIAVLLFLQTIIIIIGTFGYETVNDFRRNILLGRYGVSR